MTNQMLSLSKNLFVENYFSKQHKHNASALAIIVQPTKALLGKTLHLPPSQLADHKIACLKLLIGLFKGYPHDLGRKMKTDTL